MARRSSGSGWAALFFLLAQFGDDAEVFEGGDVAFDLAVGRHLAQQAAHDLAGAGFGQGIGEADVVRTGEGSNFFGDPGAQFFLELLRRDVCRLRG